MNSLYDECKTYYNPGCLCRCRHFDNSPVMYVVEKVSRTVLDKNTGKNENVFIGIKTRWFDNNNDLQEAIFSSKDLELIDTIN